MLSRFLTLFLVCFFAMNDPAGAVLREFEFSADHGEDWPDTTTAGRCTVL